MPFFEKNTWVYGTTAILGLAVYLSWLFVLAQSTPITKVDYVLPMVSTLVGAIILNILISIILGMISTKRDIHEDQRDREISERGEYRGHIVLVAGAIGALLLAFFEQPYFWIANTIYLSFMFSAVLATIVKIISYRRGF